MLEVTEKVVGWRERLRGFITVLFVCVSDVYLVIITESNVQSSVVAAAHTFSQKHFIFSSQKEMTSC